MRVPACHCLVVHLFVCIMRVATGKSIVVWYCMRLSAVHTAFRKKKDVDNNKDKRKVQARTEMRQKNEAHADCGICMQVTLLFVHR